MDDYIKEKIEELRKSMYKKVEKLNKKGVIEDLNDSNMIAESKEDEDDTKSGSIVNKKSEHDCDCEDKDDCECDEVKKGEAFIRDMVKNFKTISEQYLAKARVDEGKSKEGKVKARKERNSILGSRGKKVTEARRKYVDPKGVHTSSGTYSGKDRDKNDPSEKEVSQSKIEELKQIKPKLKSENLAKARSEEGMPASAKRAMRQARNKNLKPKKRERSDLDRTKRKLVEEPKAREKNIERIKNKQRKLKPKETAEIRGFEEEKLAASEKEKARMVSQEEKNFLSGVKRGKKDWEGIKENSPPPVPKEKEKLAASEKRKS